MDTRILLVSLSLLIGGCVTLNPEAGVEAIRAELPQAVARDELLARPLDADAAVQVALLSHPRVQTILDGLRISEAERVQAIRLRNPTLEIERNELKLVQPLLDLLTLRARTARADTAFEAKVLEAKASIITLDREVRDAWVHTIAAGQREKLADDAFKAADAALAFRQALRAAGNITELELVEERLRHEEAQLALELARAEWTASRERFQLALGDVPQWRVVGRLPAPPSISSDEPPLDPVLDANLHLAARRKRLESLAQAAGIADSSAWVTHLDLGLRAHRDAGDWSYRPMLEVTLPVFDTGSARRAAAHARLSQASHEYASEALRVRADARRLHVLVTQSAASAQRHSEELIPAHEAHIEQTLRQVNAMQLGVFDLLEARRKQIAARRSEVDTLERYWLHRNALNALIAGGY